MQLKSCILHKCCLLHKPSCDSPSPLEDSFPTLHLASQPWDVAGFPMPDIQVTAKACHVTKLNHCSPHNVCLSTGPPENTAHSHHSCNYVRKIIADAELVNSKLLLLGKYRVRYLGASGHNIFTSWSVHSRVNCMYLFKGTLFNRYHWVIHRELGAISATTHAYKKLI